LSYVIIRKITLKEVIGEIIVTYLNQSECIKIKNRVLHFNDVQIRFPNLGIADRELLYSGIKLKKTDLGWSDC